MPLKYKVLYVFLYFKYCFHCFIPIYFNSYSLFLCPFHCNIACKKETQIHVYILKISALYFSFLNTLLPSVIIQMYTGF